MSAPRGIVIEQYSEQWPSEFAKVKELLGAALGDVADRIDHIGSTSVPGLAAKDIIDVQVGVADLGHPRLLSALEELGCQATDITSDHVPPGDRSGPAGWEKRYFRPPENWRPTHLHVRESGRPNYRYALLFRDYLRDSGAAAAAYAQVKGGARSPAPRGRAGVLRRQGSCLRSDHERRRAVGGPGRLEAVAVLPLIGVSENRTAAMCGRLGPPGRCAIST